VVLKIPIVGLAFLICITLVLGEEILLNLNYISLYVTGILIITMSCVNSAYSRVVTLVLLVFFFVRNLQLMAYPERFTYNLASNTSEALAYTTTVLAFFALAIGAGSFIGITLARNRKTFIPTRLLPFEDYVRSPKLYFKIAMLIFTLANFTLITLRITSGSGMPGLNNYLDATTGYFIVLLRIFQPLSISIVVYYLAFKKEKDHPSWVPRMGVVVCFLAAVLSFSKAGLLYFMLPFFLYFLVSGIAIPRKMLIYGTLLIGLSVFVYGALMGAIRAVYSGYLVGKGENLEIDIYSILTEGGVRFMDRVGSSFDVIHGVLGNLDQFKAQSNLFGQFATTLNHYIPGEIIAVGDHTLVGHLLPVLLRGTSLENIGGYGENINSIGIALVSFDFVPALIFIFLVAMFGAIVFYHLKSTAARVFILIFLITNLSNGGELGSYIEPLLFFFTSHVLVLLLYLFAIQFDGSRYRSGKNTDNSTWS